MKLWPAIGSKIWTANFPSVKVRLQTEWQGFDDSGVLFNLEKYKVTTSSKIIYNKKIIIISKLRYIYVSLFAENNTIVGEVPHCLVS